MGVRASRGTTAPDYVPPPRLVTSNAPPGEATYDALGGAGTFLVAAAFTALAAVRFAMGRPVPAAVVREATDAPIG